VGLSILETAIYASDLDAAERFYGDVLGLPFDSKVAGRHIFFHCGDAMLLVFNPAVTAVKAGDVPPHGARGPGHVAFAVGDGELEPWLERLAEHGVEIEASVDWPGGGRSIYFRDPGGNSLELTTPSIWGIGTDH
jgi:catechol 2,3-dioxygenase-like lactoylglutathione lyase family enzyme